MSDVKLVGDEYFAQSGLVLVGVITTGTLNYLYQIFMGRFLTPEEFGAFGALFAFFYFATMMASTVNTSVTKHIAECVATNQMGKVRNLVRRLLAWMGVIGGVFFLVFAMARYEIAQFLRVENTLLVMAVGAGVIVLLTLPVTLGTFKGMQRFRAYVATNVLNASAKLFLGMTLVFVGFGILGALGAVAVGALIAFAVSVSHMRGIVGRVDWDGAAEVRPIFRFAAPVALVTLAVVVPGNVDVVFMKHFADGLTTGLYTGVSVLGRIILFLPLAFVTVLFPKVASRRATGAGSRDLLVKAFAATLLLVLVLFLPFALAPEFVIGSLLGANYVLGAVWLPWYGAALGVFSLAYVLVHYDLARGRIGLALAFPLVTAAEVLGLWWAAGDPMGSVQVLLGGSATLLVAGLVRMRWSHD